DRLAVWGNLGVGDAGDPQQIVELDPARVGVNRQNEEEKSDAERGEKRAHAGSFQVPVGYSSGMPAAPLLLALLLQAAPGGDLASISGRITDRDTGRPLPRMIGTLYGGDRAARAEAATTDEGRYEFTALPPGKYAVAAGHDEHRSTYLRRFFAD